MSVDIGVCGESAVHTRGSLLAAGVSESTIRAQVAARRWQRIGRAYVLHNGPVPREQCWQVALACAGPRAVLTSFTALESLGLERWERDTVHVLVGAGDRAVSVPGIEVRLHRTTRWTHSVSGTGRPLPGFAAVLAASSFATARPGIGLLAACVQQRLTTADHLDTAVRRATGTRHRRSFLLALADIGMGAHALSEIDFARLCRRAGLPEPQRQAVRTDRSGRRRYLDVVWRRRDGSELLVEVDGSLHLTPRRWWDDQLRQNELVLTGATVLRIPSVIVREEPALVVELLRRALRP